MQPPPLGKNSSVWQKMVRKSLKLDINKRILTLISDLFLNFQLNTFIDTYQVKDRNNELNFIEIIL